MRQVKLPKAERRPVPAARKPAEVLSTINDAIRDCDLSDRERDFLENVAMEMADDEAVVTPRILAHLDERVKGYLKRGGR